MRFFSLAIPLALSLFVAASPVAVENDNKLLVAREASPVIVEKALEERAPADVVGVLNQLRDVIVTQTQILTRNPYNADNVAGVLRTVNAAVADAVSTLKAAGANPDVNAAGLGGLLGSILGGLLGGGGKGGGLLGKRQVPDVAAALKEVLDKLTTLLRSIPFLTALEPTVSQLTAALTPVVLQLVAAVNSMQPGTVPLVQGLLNTVASLLKSLTSGLSV